jgi:hypothetical protein
MYGISGNASVIAAVSLLVSLFIILQVVESTLATTAAVSLSKNAVILCLGLLAASVVALVQVTNKSFYFWAHGLMFTALVAIVFASMYLVGSDPTLTWIMPSVGVVCLLAVLVLAAIMRDRDHRVVMRDYSILTPVIGGAIAMFLLAYFVRA